MCSASSYIPPSILPCPPMSGHPSHLSSSPANPLTTGSHRVDQVPSTTNSNNRKAGNQKQKGNSAQLNNRMHHHGQEIPGEDYSMAYHPSSAAFGNSLQQQAPPNQAAKMFVGGLPQSVMSDSLREYFSSFGPVQEAFVLMDESSGRSRGFGFVTFDSAATLTHVLNSRPHILDNKQVDCKHAVMKGQAVRGEGQHGGRPAIHDMETGGGLTSSANSGWSIPPPMTGGNASRMTTPAITPKTDPFSATNILISQQQQQGSSSSSAAGDSVSMSDNGLGEEAYFLTGGGRSYLALSGDKWLEDCAEADERKIFVGGLPDVTPAEFACYFEHFGPVSDAMVMFDRKRRRQRGFGFITFATKEGIDNALKYTKQKVKDKVVEVKMAHPLVLQNARAPAKRERDAALRALASKGGNVGNAGSQGQNPTLVSGNAAHAAHQLIGNVYDSTAPPVGEGHTSSRLVDPFATNHASSVGAVDAFRQGQTLNSSVGTKFPGAPWNDQLISSPTASLWSVGSSPWGGAQQWNGPQAGQNRSAAAPPAHSSARYGVANDSGTVLMAAPWQQQQQMYPPPMSFNVSGQDQQQQQQQQCPPEYHQPVSHTTPSFGYNPYKQQSQGGPSQRSMMVGAEGNGSGPYHHGHYHHEQNQGADKGVASFNGSDGGSQHRFQHSYHAGLGDAGSMQPI